MQTSVSITQIELPVNFTIDHEQGVMSYLTDRLSGRNAWALTFEAFDLLDKAVVVTATGRFTFRMVYQQIVDHRIADSYIDELLALNDVAKQSPALWAGYARHIVSDFSKRGWQRSDIPETRLLLSYLLYWWGAFARGYAFEVEIYHDLQQNGILFQAHDLQDRQQRFSPSDLTVHNMAGDIKTSTYFVQFAMPLLHDFYIVRLTVQNQAYTLVVFLQPPVWEKINGDTIEANLDTIARHLPTPVRIRQHGSELIILDYEEWKWRILRLQGGPV